MVIKKGAKAPFLILKINNILYPLLLNKNKNERRQFQY